MERVYSYNPRASTGLIIYHKSDEFISNKNTLIFIHFSTDILALNYKVAKTKPDTQKTTNLCASRIEYPAFSKTLHLCT